MAKIMIFSLSLPRLYMGMKKPSYFTALGLKLLVFSVLKKSA